MWSYWLISKRLLPVRIFRKCWRFIRYELVKTKAPPTTTPHTPIPIKYLSGAPDINKIPVKIIKSKSAVPRSRSKIINNSTKIKPGNSNFTLDFLPATSPTFLSCTARQRIKRNLAISDGCNVNPAISIQLRLPFIFFPKPGINGSKRMTMVRLSPNLAIFGQTLPCTRKAQ